MVRNFVRVSNNPDGCRPFTGPRQRIVRRPFRFAASGRRKHRGVCRFVFPFCLDKKGVTSGEYRRVNDHTKEAGF